MLSTFIRADRIGNMSLRQLLSVHGQQQQLIRKLRARLPDDLAYTLVHAHIREDRLYLFSSSPNFAFRLRFEEQTIRQTLGALNLPQPREIKLRILPLETEASPTRSALIPSPDTIRLINQASRQQSDPQLSMALARLAEILAGKIKIAATSKK